MGVKLVALDIDGTLLPPRTPLVQSRPPERVVAAVAALKGAGVAVVLASGRMFPGTAAVARHLGLTTPVICQQGCSVHLPSGEMTHEFPIDHDAAMSIIEYGRKLEHPYEWFNPLRYVASRWNEKSEEYAAVSGIKAEYRRDPENSGFAPTGVGIISSRDEAPLIHRALVSHHGEGLHVLDFPHVTVAVDANANKGHSLSLLCADMGIDRHETVAVGDSVNDAPMLAWAGRGYAMAHSDRYALDAADEVLADRDEALAELLESIVRGVPVR